MYSLRYGSIPIVRATGGLKDTINNLTAGGGRGNGFVFEEYSATALINVIKKAVEFFENSKAIEKIRKRIMKEDHSWKKSAAEYIAMYKNAVGKNGMKLTNQ